MSLSLFDGLRLVGVAVMVALNAFFVAAEFAIVKVTNGVGWTGYPSSRLGRGPSCCGLESLRERPAP